MPLGAIITTNIGAKDGAADPPGLNFVAARGLAPIGTRVAELEATPAGLADEDANKAVLPKLRYWSTRQSTAQLMETRMALASLSVARSPSG